MPSWAQHPAQQGLQGTGLHRGPREPEEAPEPLRREEAGGPWGKKPLSNARETVGRGGHREFRGGGPERQEVLHRQGTLFSAHPPGLPCLFGWGFPTSPPLQPVRLWTAQTQHCRQPPELLPPLPPHPAQGTPPPPQTQPKPFRKGAAYSLPREAAFLGLAPAGAQAVWGSGEVKGSEAPSRPRPRQQGLPSQLGPPGPAAVCLISSSARWAPSSPRLRGLRGGLNELSVRPAGRAGPGLGPHLCVGYYYYCFCQRIRHVNGTPRCRRHGGQLPFRCSDSPTWNPNSPAFPSEPAGKMEPGRWSRKCHLWA